MDKDVASAVHDLVHQVLCVIALTFSARRLPFLPTVNLLSHLCSPRLLRVCRCIVARSLAPISPAEYGEADEEVIEGPIHKWCGHKIWPIHTVNPGR